MNKDEILDILKRNKKILQIKFKVKKIGLFGSFARDEQKENSDIDIFVETEPKIKYLFGIEDFLKSRLHRKVDVVRKHKFIRERFLQSIEKDIIYV